MRALQVIAMLLVAACVAAPLVFPSRARADDGLSPMMISLLRQIERVADTLEAERTRERAECSEFALELHAERSLRAGRKRPFSSGFGMLREEFVPLARTMVDLLDRGVELEEEIGMARLQLRPQGAGAMLRLRLRF